ncbi:Hypothetical predicted protein [Cloeon dipterum]|uniref:CHK kinase-like domain-containing protein n=1 Tax=Cloeon dipterum TaxID=197152 RepID=A0A8S1BTS5_9INSE|nr:Hypothetical predicted protein [Cloeon dipterum]
MSVQLYAGDMIAAVKAIHGPKSTLRDFTVINGSEAAQEYLSCVVRVKAVCDVEGEEKIANFVVKMKPLLDMQRTIVEGMKVFDQEVAFYTKLLPLMKRNMPGLKIVECYFAHSEGVIVMEDLAQQGYRNLTTSLSEYREQNGDAQARMVMRELAKFHAASQGFDWLNLLPGCFEKDMRLEIEGSDAFQNMIGGSLRNSIVPIMQHMYKDDLLYIKKYTDWIANLEDEVWPFLVKSWKANPRYINAVCNGDFWANNIMFLFDPKTRALRDLRLIDFQMMRYSHVYFDLQHFFYVSTKASFREQHMQSLLRTYLDAFLAFNNVSPDLKTFDQFMDGFNETKLSAILIGLAMCPIAVAFIDEMVQIDNAGPSEDQVSKLLGNEENAEVKWAKSVKAFEEDELFRREIKVMVADLITDMDRQIF